MQFCEPRPVQAKTVVMTENVTVPENITLLSWDDGDSEGQPSLVEADIIIAGGRGLKTRTIFH